MDDLMKNIDWNGIYFGIQAVIAGVSTFSAKQFASSLLEWFKFKSSVRLGIGTSIRRPTPVGYDDGVIIDFNRKHIIIQFKDYIFLKAIKDFDQQDWAILKDKPEWMRNE